MSRRLILCFALLIAAGAPALPAQQPPPAKAPAQPVFEPYKAEKDMEVGRFYMKKGDYDAAIDRFQDALKWRPNFAVPYLMIGEAYEKKGEKKEAIAAYQKYLEILPAGEDAPKARSRIAKLQKDLDRAGKRRSG